MRFKTKYSPIKKKNFITLFKKDTVSDESVIVEHIVQI